MSDREDTEQEALAEPASAEETGSVAMEEKDSTSSSMPNLPKTLNKKKLQQLKEQHKRRGIVYLSRIPPHLKPAKLRQLLEEHGEIGRIYLAQEDPRIRKKRKQMGGGSGKNFTEGWVEFENKQAAKNVAAMLNGQPMGGKKRSTHYYDLWTLRYLPKFKWDNLTEELNYQKAVRQQRIAAEISAAKRERDFYLAQVEAAKAHTAITERREKRAREEEEAGGPDAERPSSHGLRQYGQRAPKADPVLETEVVPLSNSLLAKIAGRKKAAVQPSD